MRENYGIEARKRLMAQVLRVIANNPGLTIEKLEAIVGIDIGLSPRKLKEYLAQFVAAGKIVQTEKGFKLTES